MTAASNAWAAIEQAQVRVIAEHKERLSLRVQAAHFRRQPNDAQMERFRVALRAVELCNGNKTQAARMLKVSRSALRYWLGEN